MKVRDGYRDSVEYILVIFYFLLGIGMRVVLLFVLGLGLVDALVMFYAMSRFADERVDPTARRSKPVGFRRRLNLLTEDAFIRAIYHSFVVLKKVVCYIAGAQPKACYNESM